MSVREIKMDGDPILRCKSLEVEIINEDISKIFIDMAETMYQSGGVAIAAPQIGVLKRLVVINMGDGFARLINPKIVEVKGEQDVIEGCLSIPGKWGKIRRPKIVKVEAVNMAGKKYFIYGEEDLAKCLCHEIDHLDGILFTDNVIEFIEEV